MRSVLFFAILFLYWVETSNCLPPAFELEIQYLERRFEQSLNEIREHRVVDHPDLPKEDLTKPSSWMRIEARRSGALVRHTNPRHAEGSVRQNDKIRELFDFTGTNPRWVRMNQYNPRTWDEVPLTAQEFGLEEIFRGGQWYWVPKDGHFNLDSNNLQYRWEPNEAEKKSGSTASSSRAQEVPSAQSNPSILRPEARESPRYAATSSRTSDTRGRPARDRYDYEDDRPFSEEYREWRRHHRPNFHFDIGGEDEDSHFRRQSRSHQSRLSPFELGRGREERDYWPFSDSPPWSRGSGHVSRPQLFPPAAQEMTNHFPGSGASDHHHQPSQTLGRSGGGSSDPGCFGDCECGSCDGSE